MVEKFLPNKSKSILFNELAVGKVVMAIVSTSLFSLEFHRKFSTSTVFITYGICGY